MANELTVVLQMLKARPNGLTRAELLRALRDRWPSLQPGQLENFLRTAGQAITEKDDRFFAAPSMADEHPNSGQTGHDAPSRFVALDLESIVRPVTTEPYKEQHVFQVGAVRFGPDRSWVGEARFFNAYTELKKPEDELLIHNEDVRHRYLSSKEPMAVVLERFNSFCQGADVLVAYNGVGHDFPLLAKEYDRAGVSVLYNLRSDVGPRLVDGLYLAHALWPIPPRQHRLRQLLERLEVQIEDLTWHDALDDAKMLVALLDFGALRSLPLLGNALVSLFSAAGAGSDAWEFLFSLAKQSPERRPLDGGEISRAISVALQASGRAELQRAGAQTAQADGSQRASGPLHLPTEITDGGRVDIDKLVKALRPESAEPRAEQRQLVAHLQLCIEEGRSALIEAPTGTGKSYAILAAALDWLASNTRSKVLVSTYTKQLQSQLGNDIESLSRILPELSEAADMVKGAANRLSLRALVIAVADLTQPDPKRRHPGRVDFSDDQRYRVLALYLLLRFLAQGTLTEEWEARSVDRVDVPGFFEDYCPRHLSLYLAAFSQADAGDYSLGRGEIARYTRSVREALEHSRLVIVNHALLLSHLEELENVGEHILLFVDEAHELENAATEALSPAIDVRLLGHLGEQAHDWLQDQPPDTGLERALEAVEALERYLDDERLHGAARDAFSTVEADPLGRSHLRTITVASPLQGDANVRPMEILTSELRTTLRYVGLLNEALRLIAEPSDLFEAERVSALRTRVAESDSALKRIVADLDAVLGATTTQETTAASAAGTGQVPNRGATADTPADDLIAVEADEEEVEPPEAAELELGNGDEPPHESDARRPNRVIWAEELDELRPGNLRSYRFRVSSSPIELGRERDWRGFRARFPRSYFVSGTLRVAGSWDFIRRRLALEDQVEVVSLPSPFDFATQAELVCFEDFPSWTEHDVQAMRSVAWQLSGYAEALIQDASNGAMVLTTARSTAAGIFDWLARIRVERNALYPLFSAGIEGNQRAVEAFRDDGGILVGTRGLWQGVDIAEPERLRLVWINKLPFAPFGEPVIMARRELARLRAEESGSEDPEGVANEDYYLPLAALAIRQAVGRLIRSRRHRGVIVISDRKLAGPTRLRRLYRKVFLGSLESDLKRPDPETGEEWLGNLCTMREGWRRIFEFLARERILSSEQATDLITEEKLITLTELPETLAVLRERITDEDERALRAKGGLADDLVARSLRIARHLNPERTMTGLKDKQEEVIRALAAGKDVLAVLPTGYGKTYCFQLPALALPGVTIVVSPLVSLMTDQALALNRTIGGRVRALVAPMRESNSRTGKSEVQQQLLGSADYGITLVYLSPERLCQRQFQDWIREAVRKGIVRRIALDEAHVFVQWADDFRPALRRAENFLRELKQENRGLQILALTATANEPVRNGLRSALFGLEPGERRDDFAFVEASPMRPELGIYRRTLAPHQGGVTSVAAVVERVVDAISGHAIFYCLTVRQVEALYAHLTDYLQGHPVEVFRYHGRLSDAEKAAVANAFKQALTQGEESYRRMIVVATSAFGLGIDRPDIRVVFCVSPPTDLAALYQQLGRAGRDRAGSPSLGAYTAGLVLMYPRANRTISFMTQTRTTSLLLARAAALLLNTESPLDTRDIAETLMAEDLVARRITPEESRDPGTLDAYQTQVVRVLADLSQSGTLLDLGDFPQRIEVRRSDYPLDTPETKTLVDAIVADVPANGRVDVATLYERLRDRFPDLRDPGALWSSLLDLHTLGYLDVSQRPNRRMLTAVEHQDHRLPPNLISGLSRRDQQIAREVALLRGWFTDARCCQQGFQEYFGAEALPSETCASPDNRCSFHWAHGGYANTQEEPALYAAFTSPDLRPASATTSGRRRTEQQLDRLVWHLLWHNWRGVVENLIHAVLRGDDQYYSRRDGRRKPLWPSLLLSRVRGRKPALQRTELRASLDRLINSGEVVRQGARYRLSRHAERDQQRATTGAEVPR